MNYRAVMMALIVLATGGACSPIIDARGHNTDEVDFKQIVPNQSNEEDVHALLGSPSAKSDFGPQIWYYITEHKETVGMFAPQITEQQIYAIHFDAQHKVTSIDDFKKDDGKAVQYVSKTTPTEGNEMTVMQQLFGNFGRFSAPQRQITPNTVPH